MKFIAHRRPEKGEGSDGGGFHGLPDHLAAVSRMASEFATAFGAAGRALWLRMLLSCLVDADFLDTEAFMDSGKAEGRRGFATLAEIAARFDGHMKTLRVGAGGTACFLRGTVLGGDLIPSHLLLNCIGESPNTSFNPRRSGGISASEFSQVVASLSKTNSRSLKTIYSVFSGLSQGQRYGLGRNHPGTGCVGDEYPNGSLLRNLFAYRDHHHVLAAP